MRGRAERQCAPVLRADATQQAGGSGKTLGIDNIQLTDMSLAILEPREFGCPLGSSPCSLLRHGPCFQEPNACKAILHFAKGSQHRLPIDGHVFLILRETIVQLSASGATIESGNDNAPPTNGPSRKVRLDQSKIRPSSADSNPPEAVRSSLGKKAAFAIPIRALAAAIARSAAAMSGRRSNRLEGRPGGMETTTFSISLNGTEKSAGSFPSISPGHSLQSRAGGRQQAPRCARFPTLSALAKHQTRLPARPRGDRAPIGMTHHAASRPWRISPSLRQFLEQEIVLRDIRLQRQQDRCVERLIALHIRPRSVCRARQSPEQVGFI